MNPFIKRNTSEAPSEGRNFLENITKNGRIVICVIFGLAGLYITGIIGAISVAGAKGNVLDAFKYNIFKIFAIALFTKEGLSVLPFSALIIAAVCYFIMKAGFVLSKTKTVDARGVKFSTDGHYGTAEWQSKEDAKKVYEVGPIENEKGIILGQFTENGDETIAWPALPGKNNNIVIFGSPGTGKSYCFARNVIFQSIKRGESIVITDPKGELYEDTVGILRASGYKIKVFNLLDPMRSDAWDAASEIYDPITGEVSDIRVAEFADTIMRNVTEGRPDGFWDPGETNLLKAAIQYRAYLHETSMRAVYKSTAELKLLPKLTLPQEEISKIMGIVSNERSCMMEIEMAFRFLVSNVFKGEKEKISTYIDKVKSKAEPCTIADIYYEIITNDLASFENKFSVVPISHPAAIAWTIFKNSSPNTQPGFITGLAQKLQLFQMRDMRRITSNTDINLADVGAEKTALFVAISDKSEATRAISSLFFNFLFKDLSDAADKARGAEQRLPVNLLCDEFANIGRIPGFQITISTVRSRMLNVYIILQSTTQLNKVYDLNDANTILACCDTLLFIGCNDNDTAKYISDIGGQATIRIDSYKDSQTATGYRSPMASHQVSDGAGKRNVVNADEVRRLGEEEVLIYHRGQQILKANRCGYDCHPLYKLHSAPGAPEPLPREYLRNYPLATEKYAVFEALDAFMAGDANNIEARDAYQQKPVKNEPIDSDTAANFSGSGKKGKANILED